MPRKFLKFLYYTLIFILGIFIGFIVIESFIFALFPKLSGIGWLFSKQVLSLLQQNIKTYFFIDPIRLGYYYVSLFNDGKIYSSYLYRIYAYFYKFIMLLFPILINVGLIFFPVVYLFLTRKGNKFKNFLLSFVYFLWISVFGWLKFLYLVGNILVNFLVKFIRLKILKKKLVQFIFSVLLGFGIFGLLIWFKKFWLGKFLGGTIILNYMLLIYYFIPKEKEEIAFKSIFLLEILTVDDIKNFFKKFWIGLLGNIYMCFVLFVFFLNFLILLEIFYMYMDSTGLYFNIKDALFFIVPIAIGFVTFFIVLDGLIRLRKKLIIFSLLIFAISELSFILYVRGRYYGGDIPLKRYTYGSLSKFFSYNLDNYNMDDPISFFAPKFNYLMKDFSLGKYFGEKAKKEWENVKKQIKKYTNIDIKYYNDSLKTGTILGCGDFGSCSLKDYYKKVLPLGIYKKFKEDIERLITSKKYFTYWDIFATTSNGFIGIEFVNSRRNLDWFDIVKSSYNRYFIPVLIFSILTDIRCRYFILVNDDYRNFKKFYEIFKRGIDIKGNSSIKDCIYKYAFLEGYNDILSKIEKDIFETNNSVEESIRFRDYIKKLKTGGIIKGKIKILDENGNELVYGKDYEIVIQPFTTNFHQSGKKMDDIEFFAGKRGGVILNGLGRDGKFQLSGFIVPLKFAIGIRFFDHFEDYKFIKGRLKTYQLTKEKPKIDIGEVIIKMFKKKRKINKKKIKVERGYYYIVFKNGEINKISKKTLKKLENGKFCRYLYKVRGLENKFSVNYLKVNGKLYWLDYDVWKTDCGYYGLFDVRYILDFDENKYYEKNKYYDNFLFMGRGKFLTKWGKEVKFRNIPDMVKGYWGNVYKSSIKKFIEKEFEF